MTNPVAHNITHGRRTGALWFGIAAGPIASLVAQWVNYMFVPYACRHGGVFAVMLHVVFILLMCVAATAGWVAWGEWHGSAPVRDSEADAGDHDGRRLFMGNVGFGLSLLSLLVLLAMWIPVFILHPCMYT